MERHAEHRRPGAADRPQFLARRGQEDPRDVRFGQPGGHGAEAELVRDQGQDHDVPSGQRPRLAELQSHGRRDREEDVRRLHSGGLRRHVRRRQAITEDVSSGLGGERAVSKKDVEAALARGVELLDRLLPLKSWLYFPILYAACVWAVRRVFDYRERILAWQVWLDPEFVRTKPDAFILEFFRGDKGLNREYAAEMARGDLRVLRSSFPALYSVIGLDDAFLRALFKPELDAGDFRTVVVEFAART